MILLFNPIAVTLRQGKEWWGETSASKWDVCDPSGNVVGHMTFENTILGGSLLRMRLVGKDWGKEIRDVTQETIFDGAHQLLGEFNMVLDSGLEVG